MPQQKKKQVPKASPVSSRTKTGTPMTKMYLKPLTGAQKAMAKKYAAKPGMMKAIKEGKAGKVVEKIMRTKRM